jgi:segregation and condensation protein B
MTGDGAADDGMPDGGHRGDGGKGGQGNGNGNGGPSDEAPPGAQGSLPLPGDAEGAVAGALRLEARRAIEAVVMVSEQPIDVRLLGQLLELAPAAVEELCRELAAEYETDVRGFRLARVAGGWRFQTHPDQAPYVERFVLAGQTAKLSAAALETLAIVAYKQPISRAQVSAIRGVNVDGVMRTLHQRGYIAEVGRDPGPGQAVMFGTTRQFLEKLGVDSLTDLPALGDFVPSADVVEQLEQGLRPEPTVHERLGALESTNAERDLATKAPNGTALLDLDAEDGERREPGWGHADADDALADDADVPRNDDDADGAGSLGPGDDG